MSTALAESSSKFVQQGSTRSFVRRAWVSVSTAIAAVFGLLPHVLHHAGPLAGAAIVAGTTGSLLFGAIGFVAAIPFLRRVRRRYGSWRVPAGVLAVMAVAFSLSTFIIGPAITGSGDERNTGPSQSAPSGDNPAGHEGHH